MSRKYKFSDNDKLYFISFSVINWIDLFIREEYKKVIIDSWKYLRPCWYEGLAMSASYQQEIRRTPPLLVLRAGQERKLPTRDTESKK
jgi:hypothetical protein